jgi:hypothetical protein
MEGGLPQRSTFCIKDNLGGSLGLTINGPNLNTKARFLELVNERVDKIRYLILEIF